MTDRRAIRALAAAVILDAIKLSKSKSADTKRRRSAREWLRDPHSNLDVFAGALGKDRAFFLRRLR